MQRGGLQQPWQRHIASSLTSRRNRVCCMAAYSPSGTCLKSKSIAGWRCWTLYPFSSSSYRCSMGFRSRDFEGHGSTKLPRLARTCSPPLRCGAVVHQGQLLLGGKQRHDSNVDDLIHETLIINCSLNKKKHNIPLDLYRFAFICVFIMFFSPERIANKALFLVLSLSFKTLHTHGDLNQKCPLRLLKTLLISSK